MSALLCFVFGDGIWGWGKGEGGARGGKGGRREDRRGGGKGRKEGREKEADGDVGWCNLKRGDGDCLETYAQNVRREEGKGAGEARIEVSGGADDASLAG